MDSNSITDEQGKHLRGRYFPFHLNRKLPPVTANAVHRPELVLSMKSHRASTVPHTIKKKVPTTHMILDYRQDKKHLVDQAAKELEREAAMISPISAPPPLALSPQMSMRSLDMQNNSPKNTMRKLRFEAQPLRSSFVLRKKKGLDGSIDLSDFLFNKAEAGTQTEYKVERLDLPTLGEYQAWNNTVAEPFFKELRKAVKANRPDNLEAYIISYCQAMQSNQPAPVLPPSESETRSNTAMGGARSRLSSA